MPRKPLGLRPTRAPKRVTIDEIDPGVRFALETGELPDDADPRFRDSEGPTYLTILDQFCIIAAVEIARNSHDPT